MKMEKARIFKNNRSRAIRLPKSLDFSAEVDEVLIMRVGRSRVVVPVGEGWASWFDREAAVTSDFMAERDQPDEQEREPLA